MGALGVPDNILLRLAGRIGVSNCILGGKEVLAMRVKMKYEKSL